MRSGLENGTIKKGACLMSTGRIDSDGLLWMDRGSGEKQMQCMVSDNTSDYCGDHCAMFGDPYTVNGGRTKVILCQSGVYFDTLTDDR